MRQVQEWTGVRIDRPIAHPGGDLKKYGGDPPDMVLSM